MARARVVLGDSLPIDFLYQDDDSNPTVELFLDEDSNPYNGNVVRFFDNFGRPLPQTSGLPQSWSLTWLTNDSVPTGDYYMYGRITDGVHTRYAYAPTSVTVLTETTPIVTSFFAAPNPVRATEELFLIATARDDNNSVERVEFYHDSDADGELDIDRDQRLGGDTSGPSEFTWSGPADFPPGTQRLFARAQNTAGLWSDAASTTVQVDQAVVQIGTCVSLSQNWDDPDEEQRDGFPEAGERVELELIVRNNCVEEIDEVVATITAGHPGVQVFNPRVFFGLMSAGMAKSRPVCMFLGFADATTVRFEVRITYLRNRGGFLQEFSFTQSFPETRDPVIVVDRVEWDDTDVGNDGNGNRIPESGEFGSVVLYLRNIGNSNAQEVVVCLENTTPNITFDTCHDYQDLLTGATALPSRTPFRVGQNPIPLDYTGTLFADIRITYSDGEQTIRDHTLLTIEPLGWLALEWPGISGNLLDFGVVDPEQELILSARVRNSGTAPLQVTGLRTVDNTEQEVTDLLIEPQGFPWMLAGGEERELRVTVPTTAEGRIYRILEVFSANAAIREPGVTDRLIVTGLVSAAPPAYLVPGVTGVAEFPDVSGSLIVWQQDSDIVGYDFLLDRQYIIATGQDEQIRPRVAGSLVAWDRRRPDGTCDVLAVDLLTNEQIVVANSEMDEPLIGVDNGLIAYLSLTAVLSEAHEDDGGIRNVHIYNVATRSTCQLTRYARTAFNSTQTAIDGDFGGGVLSWREETWSWDGTRWNSSNPRLLKFAADADSCGRDPNELVIASGDISTPSTNSGKITWAQSTRESPPPAILPTQQDAYVEFTRNPPYGPTGATNRYGVEDPSELVVYLSGSSNRIYATFLQFDLSSIFPALNQGGRVLDARLHIFKISGPSSWAAVEMQPVIQNWDEATISSASSTSFPRFTTETRGDDRWTETEIVRNLPDLGWIRSWTSNNYGMLLRPLQWLIDNGQSMNGSFRFVSSEGEETRRPFLEISYETAPFMQWWLWHNDGVQLTHDPINHTDAVLGDGFIIYKNERSPGLFSRELNGNTISPEQRLAVDTNTTNILEWRVDGKVLVWRAGAEIYYAVINLPDLALASQDIAFNDPTPIEGQTIQVLVTVHNRTRESPTDRVCVRLFDGEPDRPGTSQLGSEQCVEAGIPGLGEATVTFEISAPTETPDGMPHRIFARVFGAEFDPTANNTASRQLVVEDSDTSGPTISVELREFSGDGDGIFGSDESLEICPTADDGSGTAEIQLRVDGRELPSVSSGSCVISTPLATGPHVLQITATDSDLASPASSELLVPFTVVDKERLSVLYEGCQVSFGQVLDLGDYEISATGPERVLIMRNDGEQALTILPVHFPEGFSATAPAPTVLPDDFTHITLVPPTDNMGNFQQWVTIVSTAQKEPFSFVIAWRVGTARFRRSDANADARTDISDAIFLLLHLFVDGRELPCQDAADFDDNGMLAINDPIGILGFIFRAMPSSSTPANESRQEPD